MSALSRVRSLHISNAYLLVNTELDLVSLTVGINAEQTNYPYLYVRYVPIGNYACELDYYWEHIAIEYEYMQKELSMLDDRDCYMM